MTRKWKREREKGVVKRLSQRRKDENTPQKGLAPKEAFWEFYIAG
jgi:hypothetical protein